MEAIVIGGLHHNTLGVIRSLGEDSEMQINIKALLVGKINREKNIISKSKYINKQNLYYVDQDKDIPEWLIKMGTSNEQHSVVICCSDGSAEQVISNYDRLKKYYRLPSVKFDITKLMSKIKQDEIASKCGFFVPKWEVVKKGETTNWNIFPCITKPEKSVQGKGKGDIHIASSREELDAYLEEIEAEYVQIQEYLEKDFEYQLIGCSLNDGKHLIIPGYTKIIRQPLNTNTGYLVLSPIENLNYNAEVVGRFLSAIGYNGLFSLEFIRDKKGRDFFLEINLRNDGNAYCVQTAGVNLPIIWCKYAISGELPNFKESISKSVFFIPDFIDMKAGIKKEGLFGWFYQFVTAKSHSLFNLNDMGPFICEFNERFSAYIRKKYKEKIYK